MQGNTDVAYCQAASEPVAYRLVLVRERSALADPYCHLAWNSVCLFVGLFVRNFEVKYLENQRS